MLRLLFVCTLALFISCGNQATTTEQSNATNQTSQEAYFGDKISAEGAQPITELTTLMGEKKELNIKLEGEIDAVCQKKGCWMDIKTATGESMRVTFKDYAFFVPKDAAGKTAIMEGVAKIEETSIADLQEYAKDAGKSEAEIAAITQPKQELVFEASGVILK
jgi:hypothetical protein